MNNITFKRYQIEDYQKVHDFFININQIDRGHINWNFGRYIWLMDHPSFDNSLISSIGLWLDEDKVIGLAIYDMYFGEAFAGTLPQYKYLYKEILEYAYKELKNENGLGIAINDENIEEIEIATSLGFVLTPQKENMMSVELNKDFDVILPEGLHIEELNINDDTYQFKWVIWQGFDHGDDEKEFQENEDTTPIKKREGIYNLSYAVSDENGKKVSYCCFWYNPETDYAYLEPMVTIPSYRGKGIGTALVHYLFNLAKDKGIKKVYVLSDMEYYKKVGFKDDKRFSFYWKDRTIEVNDKKYKILKLLGKGKGGYSYLAENNNKQVVLKQIHHEPCDYYQFGNKIEAERHDYERLLSTGIRIPKMIDIDLEKEIIIKEYIDGPVVFDLENRSQYIPQVEEMAKLAKDKGINIDYYPTNFVVKDELLYYIDYECNEYMDEWNFPNWGKQYW